MKNKLINKASGIVTYGITPPKSNKDEQAILDIAARHIERIGKLDIDALVIYDIQDESIRTSAHRPFDFISTIDSSVYANKYLEEIKAPKIVYRCVGNYDEQGLEEWLGNTNDQYSVFVGAASKHQDVKLNLGKAYETFKKTENNIVLGAVMIPERHISKNDEPFRMAQKVKVGCDFFISQAVYDQSFSEKFLKDYKQYFDENNLEIRPIIFTLTPCGSQKTLKFIKWLGVHVPEKIEEELLNSDDMLEHSLNIIEDIFCDLYKLGKRLGIPIGCNVESVSIRKEEILASLKLCQDVKAYIDRCE